MAQEAIEQGASVLDVGAYSTRPSHSPVPLEEECSRLTHAVQIIRREVSAQVPISIDTFRAEVVQRVYDKFGEVIVNDIEGGAQDKEMLPTVGRLGLRYVMMSSGATMPDVLSFFATQLQAAHDCGVREIDLDPGFGFGKNLEQNFAILRELHMIKERFPAEKLFVGLSRKSMIYKPLGTDPQGALSGTTVLHFAALQQGADVLRVHDTLPAVQTIKLHQML